MRDDEHDGARAQQRAGGAQQHKPTLLHLVHRQQGAAREHDAQPRRRGSTNDNCEHDGRARSHGTSDERGRDERARGHGATNERGRDGRAHDGAPPTNEHARRERAATPPTNEDTTRERAAVPPKNHDHECDARMSDPTRETDQYMYMYMYMYMYQHVVMPPTGARRAAQPTGIMTADGPQPTGTMTADGPQQTGTTTADGPQPTGMMTADGPQDGNMSNQQSSPTPEAAAHSSGESTAGRITCVRKGGIAQEPSITMPFDAAAEPPADSVSRVARAMAPHTAANSAQKVMLVKMRPCATSAIKTTDHETIDHHDSVTLR